MPIGVAIPGEADSIDISRRSDEYKITKNVTFGNIRFTGGSGLYLVDATGCDEYVSDIRDELIATRDSVVESADAIIDNIIVAYQNARAKLFVSAENQCKDNSARDACIERVCAANMPNKCATGFEAERALAMQMCKFYDVACAALK